MNLPKIILVPTDFGDASDCAVEYGVTLAKALEAEVVLLHAFEIPVIGFPDGAMIATVDMTNQILAGARAGMEKITRRYEGTGVSFRSLVEQGDPWHTVLETAEKVGAELIVMGTHGRKGLPRALLGSVAEKVVRSAHIPVLTIHTGDIPLAAEPRRTPLTEPIPASRH